MYKKGAIIIEGHVQGLSNTRSLGEVGVPVYVIDKTNCIARYSKYCKKFFRCSDFISDEFLKFLIDLAKREQLQDWVLVPSNDHAAYTISRNKTELEKFYKVITPGFEIFRKIYDKSILLSVAEQSGIPVPVTHFFETEHDTIPASLEFPVIIKGKFGLTFYKAIHKKGLLASDETELRKQLLLIKEQYRIERTIVQEIIPNNAFNSTVSFTAYCNEGEIKTYWMGIKLREHPHQFGTATLAQSVNIKECYSQSVKLLRSLNYSGVCEVEYLYDSRTGDYKLIEINARTWLWVGLAKACGVDFAKMIYYHENNIKVDFPDKYLVGLKWINYLTDSFYGIKYIITGKLKIKDYLTSLKGKKVSAVFSWKDVFPGVMLLFMALHIARRRG